MAKQWFVPDGIDPAPFKQWFILPQAAEPNIRCDCFYVAAGMQDCGKCSTPVHMVAFILPRGWEEWRLAEDDDQKDRWEREEVDVILNYIGYLNDEALRAAHEISKNYKLVLQPGHKTMKYLNHCEICGAWQREPNSGNTHIFKLDTVEAAELLKIHYYNLPIECQSSFAATLRCHGKYNALDHMQHASLGSDT